jgi:hypothetical protein
VIAKDELPGQFSAGNPLFCGFLAIQVIISMLIPFLRDEKSGFPVHHQRLHSIKISESLWIRLKRMHPWLVYSF